VLTVGAVFLVLSSFLASAVEGVEALTIVLATGLTRGWRSALVGVVAALVILAVVVLIFGNAITRLPLPVLQVVIGTFLLIFGLQWLRKAILRYSGLKALHDEAGIFDKQVKALSAQARGAESIDWPGFTVAFKGVLLEGLEVAFIVVTFGASASKGKDAVQNAVLVAGVGALAALVLVTLVGLAVHRPLSRVPENTMKFGVGIMLTTFGTFWSVSGVAGDEGAWAWSDWTLLMLAAAYALVSWGLITMLRRRHDTRPASQPMEAMRTVV
jgi:uncharacterized membrane protein